MIRRNMPKSIHIMVYGKPGKYTKEILRDIADYLQNRNYHSVKHISRVNRAGITMHQKQEKKNVSSRQKVAKTRKRKYRVTSSYKTE